MSLSTDDEQKMFYIKSLGVEILLRTFSKDDYKKFNEINQSSFSAKEKVKRILYSHIISPALDYEDFDAISDSDLESLGQDFLKENFHSEKSVDKDEDFYSYFLRIIKAQQNKFTDTIQKSVESQFKSYHDFLQNINRTIAPILKSHVDSLQPQITQINETLSDFFRKVILSKLDISADLENIYDQISKINNVLTESMKIQLANFVNWIDMHDEVFIRFREYWESFERQYKITEARATEVLAKYKWLFTPSLPYTLLHEVVEIDREGGNHKLKNINHLFLNYFQDNNWKNLEKMIESWKDIPLFQHRIKIIRDCVKAIKHCEGQKINVANLVIPTLLCQIDGLMFDYLESIGFSWDNDHWGWIDHSTKKLIKSPQGKKINREDLIRKERPQILPIPLDELASQIFLDILFAKANPREPPVSNLQFNRNKIIHGENTHYGRRGYMIRAFLILDFLAHIIQQTSFQDS